MKRFRNRLDSAKEVWRQVRDFPNYFVSSNGNVFRINGKNALIMKMDHVDFYGYKTITLKYQNKSKKFRLNRLVLMAFTDIWETDKICCHVNDVKTDNNINNLYWGTPKTNAQDRLKNDLHPIGEKHGCAKLKESDVFYIYNNHKTWGYNKNNTAELARKLNVSKRTICAVMGGEFWKHLHDEHFKNKSTLAAVENKLKELK